MCINPQKAYQLHAGQKPIFILDKFLTYYKDDYGRLPTWQEIEDCTIYLKCDSCKECLESQAIEWAYRIMDESRYYSDNCVITLTYDNENVTEGLLIKEYQDFLKRYRKKLSPKRIRYFISGEYGSKKLRPHFHLIVFGHCPTDLKWHHKNKQGRDIFTSKEVADVWDRGFVSVDRLTFDSAKYSAKYMQKALKEFAEENHLQAPFIRMSLKPGIGLRKEDIPADKIRDDKIYHNGKSIKLPRYYLKLMEANGVDLTLLRSRRRNTAKLSNRVIDERDFEKNARFFGKHLDNQH